MKNTVGRKGYDLTGQLFGKLKVIRYEHTNKAGERCYLCECECGNSKVISSSKLRNCGITHCGCSKYDGVTERATEKARRHIGNIYNKLTVIDIEYNRDIHQNLLVCRCECGSISKKTFRNLEEEQAQSCSHNCAAIREDRRREHELKHRGRQIDRLLVLGVETHPGKRPFHAICLCDCGTLTTVEVGRLDRPTRSCGCLQREIASKNAIKYQNRPGKGEAKFPYLAKNGERYMMRSLYEVMYAEYLDSQNILWEFESEVFDLKPNMRYSPDFFVSGVGWVEVKGYLYPESKEKIDEFRRQGNKLTILRKADLEKLCSTTCAQFRTHYLNSGRLETG